jgi:hypothetical protein
MAIESLVRVKYFLTSEQSECFASLPNCCTESTKIVMMIDNVTCLI